ncbi:SPFH domain-containing protein [Vagococcus jeotgali]|uniref:SPFH domain-containing protein n=1 Tax=Vagococcus jeotgali TaxID=3109030 RepID=UPI002DD7D45F|nr:SPFH domain-containing protein [Vagococcus sp. B2T-5]
MGLIKTGLDSIGGGLADQWLEVIEPFDLSDDIVMTTGVQVRKDSKRQGNKKGTEGFISDGSVVYVYPNTMMLLIDGGKIIDYTAEEGYYTVDNASAPSMFSGSLKESIAESFNRFKYGGLPPQRQQVVYINLQEIRGIKFGTPAPLNYFDNFYNAELFLRAHGTYSIKIVDPILFYTNVLPKNKQRVTISEINDQFLSEFLTALQTSINQMSQAGERISYISSKSMELSKFMSSVLDEDWTHLRGMEVVSVGVSSISYTDDSKELINMRNKGAMLGDAAIREGFVQGSVAEGLRDAGSNPGGSVQGFMGVNMGMGGSGDYLSQSSRQNHEQMKEQVQQANPVQSDIWICSNDQTENTGKFCSECGQAKPVQQGVGIKMRCANCHEIIMIVDTVPKFCPECGQAFQGLPL